MIVFDLYHRKCIADVVLLGYLDTVFSQTKFWQADCSCDIANRSVFTEWNNDAALSAHIIWPCIWCGTCLCNLQESDRIGSTSAS